MKKLSQSGRDALNSKYIRTYSKVLINGIEVKPQDYSYSFDKSFGAASCRISLPNQDGRFSPHGSNPIKWNDSVVIEEGLYNTNGQLEKWTKFTGLIRQTVPRIERGIQTLELTALDKIIRLEDLDLYEHFFEANKTEVGGYAGVKLKPRFPGDEENWEQAAANAEYWTTIFDFYDKDWDLEGAIHLTDIAPNPIPRIKVRDLNTFLSDPKWEGFEINYQQGQLILGTSINIQEYEIFASFCYYKITDGLYVEDLIKFITISQDGYGNYPINEDDIKTDLFAEDGVSEDIMTPDYNEIEDGKTKNWFLSYSNVITDLDADDFEIPGGASFSSFNKRYGKLILDITIPLNSTVKCKTNYSFWTIQATGIQTPYLVFPAREIPNRFEAINQIRKLTAPNFIARTRGDGKIWFQYLNQKINEDYILALKERLEYSPDIDIYTRVKIFGESADPPNIMRGLTKQDYEWGYKYITEAPLQDLELPFPEGEWLCFRPSNSQGLDLVQILSNPYPPRLWINNVEYGTGKHFIVSNKGDINWETLWGYIIIKKDTGDKTEGLWFKGTTDMTEKINLYNWGEGGLVVGKVIYPDDPDMEFNYDNYRYEWKPNKTSSEFGLYIAADFYINTSNAFEVDFKRNLFKIKSNVVQDKTITNNILVGKNKVISNLNYEKDTQINDGIDHNFPCFGKINDNNPTGWGELYFNLEDNYYVKEIRFEAQDVPLSQPYEFSGIYGSHFEVLVNTLNGWEKIYNLKSTRTFKGKPASDALWNLGGLYEGVKNYNPLILKLEYPISGIKIRVKDDYGQYGGFYYTSILYAGEIRVKGAVLHDDIKANFWYSAMATIPDHIKYLHDGLYSTQVQSIYFYKPVQSSVWATFDFGEEKHIQAIDLIAGFYIPNKDIPDRKYDIKMNLTLQYALDAEDIEHATFYEISREATGFDLNSGDKVSFEPDELGENFKMRWLRIIMNNLGQIDALGKKVYVLALRELAVYTDVYLESEAKLAPGGTSFPEDPEIDDVFYRTDEDKWYIYKSGATPFWEEFENQTYIYDSLNLLSIIGDRLYKDSNISKILNTQELLDRRAKALLKEFVKENSKCSAKVAHSSHLELGMTVSVNDPYSKAFSGSEQNYFIDNIQSDGSLVLARYE